MTHWKTLVPSESEYLQAADLSLAGGQTTARIDSIPAKEIESDDGVKKIHGVIQFKDKKKGFVFNHVNGALLAAMFGDDIEGWIGKAVTLHVVPCEIRGQYFEKPCIRVKGSPELNEDINVAVKLPRRKPLNYTLTHTTRQGQEQ